MNDKRDKIYYTSAEEMYDELILKRDQLRRALEELELYHSGEAEVRLREQYKAELAEKDREIATLDKKVKEAHAETRKQKAMYEGLLEDEEADYERRLKAKEMYRQEAVAKLKMMDEALENAKQEIARLQQEVSRLTEENEKLTIRLNMNFENSSLTSATKIGTKNIYNGRKKTGKDPGAQPGHEAHARKKHEPTETIFIETPKKFLDKTKYRYNGEVSRQVVNFSVTKRVTEYVADEYVEIATGRRVHAAFPENVKDDVNYGDNVKAFSFLLNEHLNVSVQKTHDFMEAFLGGIAPSTGWISHLTHEFSAKTEEEYRQIISGLCDVHVLHGDFTFADTDGDIKPVVIMSGGKQMLFMPRENRKAESLKDTPLEYNPNVRVCDEESVIKKTKGRGLQLCLAHVQRHLREAAEVDGDLTWHKHMLEWTTRAIRYADNVKEGTMKYDEAEVQKYLNEYDDIMRTAETEYREHPPRKSYTRGEKLSKRMRENKKDYTLFLTDLSVPPTNNICEQGARKLKMKLSVSKLFRSLGGLEAYCKVLTILESSKLSGENIFEKTKAVFANSIAVPEE